MAPATANCCLTPTHFTPEFGLLSRQKLCKTMSCIAGSLARTHARSVGRWSVTESNPVTDCPGFTLRRSLQGPAHPDARAQHSQRQPSKAMNGCSAAATAGSCAEGRNGVDAEPLLAEAHRDVISGSGGDPERRKLRRSLSLGRPPFQRPPPRLRCLSVPGPDDTSWHPAPALGGGSLATRAVHCRRVGLMSVRGSQFREWMQSVVASHFG